MNGRDKRKYLLVYCEDDERQLPIIVARTVKEMANKLGMDTASTASAFNHANERHSTNTRYRKVFIDDDDWDDDLKWKGDWND